MDKTELEGLKDEELFELQNSISELEPLFVANTLLGSISLGFIIEFGNITVFQIANLLHAMVRLPTNKTSTQTHLSIKNLF